MLDSMSPSTDQIKALIPHIVSGFLVLALFIILRIIVYFASKKIRSGANRAQNKIYSFVVKTVATLIWTLAVIYVLGAWGVNISALVASLGLVSFSIGLALKDAISNALSGALILLYHPFRLHDHIKSAGVDGIVTDINMRYITIRDIKDSDLSHLIPNSKLLSEKITLVKRKEGESIVITKKT